MDTDNERNETLKQAARMIRESANELLRISEFLGSPESLQEIESYLKTVDDNARFLGGVRTWITTGKRPPE